MRVTTLVEKVLRAAQCPPLSSFNDDVREHLLREAASIIEEISESALHKSACKYPELIGRIESYVARHGLNKTAFGKLATNDYNLVDQIMAGRELRMATLLRIEAVLHDERSKDECGNFSSSLDQHSSLEAQEIISEIKAFLKARNMKPCRFGQEAMNDSRFMTDLIAGRELLPSTVQKIRKFMAGAGDFNDRRRKRTQGTQDT